MKALLFILFTWVLSSGCFGQEAKKEIRQGNRMFSNEKFSESETAYRKALQNESRDSYAAFNLGDALYRQEKFDDARQQFEVIAGRETNKINSAKAFHNLGNSNLQAGKIEESINAYKEALRRNPADLDTKYNLAFAQNLKKKEQQKQEQQPQDNQDKKDQQKDQQQKDQQQKDQQQKDQQQQTQDKKQQPAKISKEDAKRLLEALANDEKKVQDKVKKQKAAAVRTRSIKDW